MSEIIGIISAIPAQVIQKADRFVGRAHLSEYASVRNLGEALNTVYFEYRQSEDYKLILVMGILLDVIEMTEIGLDEHKPVREPGETDEQYQFRLKLLNLSY